jgi:outer membrane protein OmpA-like peptidoglycan-associated protein
MTTPMTMGSHKIRTYISQRRAPVCGRVPPQHGMAAGRLTAAGYSGLRPVANTTAKPIISSTAAPSSSNW